MTIAIENTERVSSKVWTLMIESGQDDFYVGGVFTDEDVARATLADLSERLEEENNIHTDYTSNRITARLISHPVHDAAPQFHMLYTVHALPDNTNPKGWVVFLVQKELHTTTSLFEYARTSEVARKLLSEPTKAFRDDSISGDDMQVFLTFDPDNVTFAAELPA